jgi:hypothetical protein
MNKQLIGILGPSTGGKSTLCDYVVSSDPSTYVRIAFADYLKEEALHRGWSGRKDSEGRKFLQVLSEQLKQDHGESVFYDVGILKAFAAPQPIILFDDARFLIEITNLFADHETWTGSCFVFDEPEAEQRWEDSVMATGKDFEWAKHRSEVEWRSVRDIIARSFPTFTNDKTLGIEICGNRFLNHVNQHINIIEGVTK